MFAITYELFPVSLHPFIPLWIRKIGKRSISNRCSQTLECDNQLADVFNALIRNDFEKKGVQ
jgi:hypothetical protein